MLAFFAGGAVAAARPCDEWQATMAHDLDDDSDADGLFAVGLDDVLEDDDASIDAELEAAIEYKLATSGIAGVSRIFEIVRDAVRRRTS